MNNDKRTTRELESSNRGEGDMWFMNSIDEDCAIVSDDKGFILEAPDMETGRELCKRWNEAPELAKENQALKESNTRLKERIEVLEDALEAFITFDLSDTEYTDVEDTETLKRIINEAKAALEANKQ